MRRAHTERESSNEERSLRAACRSRWRSPSPGAAGRRERTSRTSTAGTPADAGQDERVRGPRPRHAEGHLGRGLGRAARRAQGAQQVVRGEVPERDGRTSRSATSRAGSSRPSSSPSSDNPPDVFAGNQGYQLDGELVKAGLILPLDRVRQGVRLGQVLHAGDAAAVRVDRRRPDVRRGHAVGRRPDRPVGRRVRQQEEARRGGRRSRVAEDVRRLRRRAGQAARVAARRRAGDHARQQGPVRRDPPLGRDPGRLHAGAGHPRLDLPARTARRSTPRATSSRSRSSRSGRTRATSARATRTTRATTRTPAVAFGKGEGALLIGGNWNAATASDGLGNDAEFFNMPPGESGKHVASARRASRCTSRPRRSSRTSRRRTSTGSPGRPPPRRWSTPSRCRRRPTRPPSPATRSARRSRTGWDQLVEDGGLTLYPDWSSPTMLQTMGQTFQEMLAGRISPQDVISRTQKRLGGVPPGARGGLVGWRSCDHAGSPARPRAPATARRAAAGARPRAGRAAAGRLPVPRARVRLLPAVRVRPARLHGVAVVLRLGRADGRHVGRARQLREGPERPGHPRVVRPLVRADLLLRGPAGASSACCSPR